MEQIVINKDFEKHMSSICGISCYYKPDKCECFGVLTEIEAEEMGFDQYDNLEEDAFYKMEDCPFYNEEKYFFNKNSNINREYITKFIKDWFKDIKISKEDIKKHIDISLALYNEGKDYSRGITISKVFLSMEKKDNSEKRKEYVYLLHSKHGTKIGRSYNPEIRSRLIGTEVPFKIDKTEIFNVKNMSETERYLHKEYSEYRLNGEWFDLSENKINSIRDYVKSIVPTQKQLS